jgi:integrase
MEWWQGIVFVLGCAVAAVFGGIFLGRLIVRLQEKHLLRKNNKVASVEERLRKVTRGLLSDAKINLGIAIKPRTDELLPFKTDVWDTSRNVADGVDVPRARRPEMQTWNEDDITLFLEAAKTTPYYALFYTALYTGMRRSELLGLKWNDVDLILGEVSVTRSLHHLMDGSYIFTEPKSAKSRRTIALPPSAILTLREHHEKQKLERIMLGIPLTGDDLVFSTLEGKPLRPNTITRAWAILAARCGVKVIRLHDARHTHASLMLKQGIHPKIVQERLGHATIAITLDTYSHVAPGLQETAAKRFDEAFATRYNDTVSDTVR